MAVHRRSKLVHSMEERSVQGRMGPKLIHQEVENRTTSRARKARPQ